MTIIEEYFLLFAVYSSLGWCMETTLVSIQSKKFINRGFLFGPSCPIYGLGAIAIVTTLGKFTSHPVALFVLTVAVCGTLEYITSWIMEITFKARWWDYSDKKFNLNGRICLENLVAFGILGLLSVYVLNPFLLEIIRKWNNTTLDFVVILLATLYIIDTVISFIVIFGFRKVTKEVNNKKNADNTEQITKMVRELFSSKSFFHRRFINAYPRLEAIQIKIKQIKTKIGNVTNDAKDAVVEKTSIIKNNIEKGTSQVKSKIEGKIKRK